MIANADCDIDYAMVDDFGQWSKQEVSVMTNAPADLLDVQRYCAQKTGLPTAELGIVGDAVHSGGYHCGFDRVVSGDYSVVESGRDKTGLTLSASAFDLGGNFSKFRQVTLAIVDACKRGDPRAKDIRSVIYTPDGTNVVRWDRLGIRSGGDSSHLFHTHLSFFRDSEGRRNRDDNFLGLLKFIFEGDTDVLSDNQAALLNTVGHTVAQAILEGKDTIEIPPALDSSGRVIAGTGGTFPNKLLEAVKAHPSVVIDAATLTATFQDPAVQAVFAAIMHIPSIQDIEDAAFRGANRAEDA